MKYSRMLMGFTLAALLLAPAAKGMASQAPASTTPVHETQTSTTSRTENPIARLFHQRSVTSGLIGAYAAGAALGVLDWAGLHRLDHPVHKDTNGIWSIARAGQFPAELIGVTLAGAIWEGGNNRLGRTLWQSVDAAAIAGISTEALKYTFQRERPSQTSDPNQWFQGAHAQSFPSGDVSSITALVTPIILEYHRTDPWVYALATVPAFDMAARVKAHGHWQTDVVSGAVVGAVSGYFAHRLKEPFILSLLPHGFYVGLKEGF